jgi:hypothetical protein
MLRITEQHTDNVVIYVNELFLSILEPLATFGGLAVLMLAANSIVCKLSAQTQSESITEAVVEEFATDDDNQETQQRQKK